MKKSHLLWKILVVVMIVSAMMATFIACGEDHVAPNDCVDDNGDYKCDVCGAWMTHPHKDENWDDVCDICGEQGKPGVHCDWGYHRDQNGDHMCDDCTTIFGAEAGWNGFIAEIDKVIASAGSMGKLETMGGSLTAGIKFEQEEFTDKNNNKTEAVSHDIEINLDFGLDLATEFTPDTADQGSGNAFGVTITDTVGETTTTLLGLWYVDNGSDAKNYILAKFGEEEFKINAPSLAETFANYPINVDVNIADKVNGVNVSGNSMVGTIVGVLSGILPLQVNEGTNSTTYSIPLTDFLFNKVGMTEEAYGLGALLNQGLASLAGITDLINAIGLDSSALLDTLDALLPGLALDVTFNRDAAGNTNGVALGLSIAGEPMSVELYHPTADTTDGLIYDIFKTEADEGEGTIIINNGFGDIEMDVTLGYEFGSNAMGSADDGVGYKYSDAIKADYAAAEAKLTNAKEIGLINAAIEGEVTLGLGDKDAATYPVKIAIDLNPSVLTKDGLLTDAYVINDKGEGIQDEDGNPKMVKAINLNEDETVTAYEIVLSAIDNLYIKLGNLEVSLRSKTVNENGTVNFAVDLAGLSWIRTLLEEGFGVNLGSASEIFDALSDGENKEIGSTSMVRGIVLGLLKGLVVKGFQYDEPATFVTETSSGEDSGEGSGEGSGASSGEGSGSSFALTDIIKYIDMFKFDRTDKNTLKLTVDEDDMNGAGVKFEATASVTRDADDAVDSLTLSLGETGLVINGSDDVDTTLKMVEGYDYILKVGGDGNLFKAAINAVVKDERDIKEGTDAEGIKFYYLDKNGNGKYDEPVKNDKGELVGDEIIDAATAKSKDMNLTIGLNLKGIGYGVVPKVGVTQITEANFGDLFSNTNLSISVE